MHKNRLAAACAAACLAGAMAPGIAHATDGYFQPGYSVRSVGMGGVGIALPQDALAAATNPAGMALVGNRFDAGLTIFHPDREAQIAGATYGGNDQTNFLIPEVGYNRMLNQDMSVGISLYGNGGMNSGYSRIDPRTGLLPGVGVDLQQMFISPSFAWRVTPSNTIGVALDLVHQTFRANGLNNFASPQLSIDPTSLQAPGHDSSDGVGVRIGWIGELAPGLSVGATFQPKIHMGSFSAYRGLFADGGSFDIPANYGVGVSWQATPSWTVAADVERILYSGVSAISNPSLPLMTLAMRQPAPRLGDPGGAGFGWGDVTVFKVGAAWKYSDALTLRAGWNHTDNPVTSADVFFNTISPGVVKDHLTLGLTYALSSRIDVSADYVHAFKNSVSGYAPSMNGQGQITGKLPETLSMTQDSLGVAIGYKF
jgi:long-chain fatty acid transport protein